MVKVRLLKAWLRYPEGTELEVLLETAERLVKDKHAEVVAPKTGAKPSRTKVAKAESVKGGAA